MKKMLLLSGLLLAGLVTMEISGQNSATRQTTSSSRTQTTSSNSANSSSSRQMHKGDAQLNKANASYQRAQTPASRPSNSSTTNRVNTSSSGTSSTVAKPSSTTTRPVSTSTKPVSTATKPVSTANKPASASSSSVNATTKPATTTTTVTRTTTTNAASSSSKATTAGSVSSKSNNSTVPAVTVNTSEKRGYTSEGQARPQPAPAANNAPNAPRPTPYVHPNHHNFGHHMDVPPRIRPVYYHGHPYYFYNSLFCQYVHGHYVICRPPIGAVIAHTIFHTWSPIIVVYKNVNYYYDDGSFYLPSTNKVDYVVVDPPIGARVAELPSNYEEIVLDNQIYFKVDNVYYKEVVVSGYLWYEVVFVS